MNDILVRVGADISNFSKGMSDAAKQAGAMGDATQKGTLTIGKLVGAIGGIKLLSAGFDMVKSSISQAFNRIDTMEQFDRVMTTMTGSSEKAAQVLDTVNDTVKGTAYGLDVAAKSTQQFVTSGMDVDKATESISTWGDAVAFYGDGSNETFASVTDALAKMTGKGKVQMDTMNRLVEAGIPAMEIYADATGQSTEEVAEQMQKGELDAEHFMDVMNDALVNGTESFEGIEGAAKEAGASWGAAFDNMRAAVARGVTSIIESIDEMLTNNGLPSMRDLVAEFGSFFEETLNKIANNIPNVISAIQGWKESLEPIQPLIVGIVSAIAILVTASAAFGTIRGLVAGLTTAVSLLGRTFGLTTAPMFAIIAVLALVGAAVYQLWQTNEEFRNNVQIIWEHIQQIFSMVMENMAVATVVFIGALMELINAMMPVIASVAETAASFLGWIVTMMETHTWVSNVVTVAVALFGALAVGIPIIAGIVKVFTMVWSILKVVWTVVTFVANVFRVLFTVVRVVTAVLGLFLSPLGIIITVATAVGGIIVWLGGKFEWIGNIVDTVTGWMSDAWNGFLDFLGFGTEKAAESAGTSITNLAGTTAQSTAEAAQSAETNIGGMHESMNTHFDGMSQYGVGQLNQLNTQGSSEMQSLNYAGVMELAGLSTEGQASLGSLNTQGSSEMQNLHLMGAAEMAGLSTDSQSSMSEMALGSTTEVAGMNTDITSMLSELESSGSFDMESLNSNVTGDIGDMSSMSMEEISALTSSGAEDFSGLESDMTSSASSMESEVTSSFSGMSSSIESEMSNIESTASSSLDGLASNFKSSMSDISNVIKSSMQNVAQSTQKGMQSVTNAATKGMQQTSRAINQGTTRMNTDVTRSMTQMQRVYTQGFTRIATLTRSNMNRIVNVTNSGMSSVNSAFSNGMNRSASISQSTGNRIVSIFRNLQGQLRSAGAMAMAGLQSGLNSRSGGVMNTARNIANRVASTMRAALKVKSPSRITRAIGGFTGEGLEIGLIRSQSAVLKAANGLAEAAKPNVDMSYATPDGMYGSLSSAVNGAVSVNAQSRDRALIASIDGIRREIAQMKMEMDGETVGRMVEPGVSRKQSRDNSRRKRYPSGRGGVVTT